MNSKQRTACTVDHREPDRVPIGEWGIDHDHLSRILGKDCIWRNRRETTLLLWQNRRDEYVARMKEDLDDMQRVLDYDVITVEIVPPASYHTDDCPKEIAEGVWQDKRGNVYKYASSNDSILCVTKQEGRFSLSDAEVSQQIENAGVIDPTRFELIDYACKKYGSEKTILCRDVDNVGHLIGPFGGDMEHQLILTLTEPEEVKRLAPAAYRYNHALIEHFKQVGVDIMMTGYDYGMNTGTIMRPETIRDIFFPVMRTVNKDIADAGMTPFFHCCGRVWDIMDDFVQAGFRGYQSIQESAGMDNTRMKKEYGDKLTMWTGVQCETLVSGSLAQTEEEVRRNLDLLMPGGGFIFGSTNSVQYGAKTENYVRALELVRKYGVYR